ncbi:hypothetical protein MY535_04940 [Haemophilus influenzae]|nr:hypothetical protein [Haemophilus influenzae]
MLECPFLVIGKKAVRFSKLILFQVKLAISPALIAVSIAKRNAAPCNFVRFLAVQYVRHHNLTQKSDAQFHVHYIDEFLALVLLVSQDILGGAVIKSHSIVLAIRAESELRSRKTVAGETSFNR